MGKIRPGYRIKKRDFWAFRIKKSDWFAAEGAGVSRVALDGGWRAGQGGLA
jgi:hypothetical protein